MKEFACELLIWGSDEPDKISLIIHLQKDKVRLDVSGVTFPTVFLFAAFFLVVIEQARVQCHKRRKMQKSPHCDFAGRWPKSSEKDSNIWPWSWTSCPYKQTTEIILLCQGPCLSWEQLLYLGLSVCIFFVFLYSKLEKQKQKQCTILFSHYYFYIESCNFKPEGDLKSNPVFFYRINPLITHTKLIYQLKHFKCLGTYCLIKHPIPLSQLSV